MVKWSDLAFHTEAAVGVLFVSRTRLIEDDPRCTLVAA